MGIHTQDDCNVNRRCVTSLKGTQVTVPMNSMYGVAALVHMTERLHYINIDCTFVRKSFMNFGKSEMHTLKACPYVCMYP